MFGFVIGTACLIGLITTLKRARWAHRHGGWGHHGCGHARGGCGGGWGGGGWGRHGGGFGGPPWARHEEPYRGGEEADRGDEWGPRFRRRGGGGGFGGGPRGMILRFLSERLDATPAQEKVIAQAIDELEAAGSKAKEGVKRSRVDVARAVRSEGFDVGHIGEVFAKHDEAIDSMRKAFVTSMQKVHDALEEPQRKVLADLIESGPGVFRGFRGAW
ncbi:MAG: hypothetical protein NVS3B10_20430 [Polyangiales bacterium]